jgi:hypothetical protein
MLTISALITVSILSKTVPPRVATAARAAACPCRTPARRAAKLASRAAKRELCLTIAGAAGSPESSKIYRPGTTWPIIPDDAKTSSIAALIAGVFIDGIRQRGTVPQTEFT